MAADGDLAARDRRQAGDQPPGGAADARVGRAAALPADAAGLDVRSARAGAAEAARDLVLVRITAGVWLLWSGCGDRPHSTRLARVVVRALAHKAVNLDLPGTRRPVHPRRPRRLRTRHAGRRRGNDRPLRAEDLQEHGPSDVSLLANSNNGPVDVVLLPGEHQPGRRRGSIVLRTTNRSSTHRRPPRARSATKAAISEPAN